MQIQDGWEFEDAVSGLKLKVHAGVLQIERISEPIANNRDFFFTEEGEFTGTGTSMC